jgi:site-specific recombinase XerD
MTSLRQKMIKEMTLREFSPRTQEAYLSAVAGLAKHYKQSPDKITKGMIREYLLYLIEERKLAWSSRNIVVSGLRFFYSHTIGKKSLSLSIPPRKQVTQLPEILSAEELESLFVALSNQKHRTLLMTTYAAGLRVSEVVGLKVTDIDSKRMMIRVQQGKGRKDRYTVLSKRLLTELRIYWKMYKPPLWLFFGTKKRRPLTDRSAQVIYYSAKKKAGITKGKGIHTLRHCFATHLLEAGVNLRTIQMLMGHRSILTTMIYLQVTRKQISSTQSPLDLLELPESNDFFKE